MRVLSSPLPANDAERVLKLRTYCVLDTAEEPLFDRLAQLARQIAGTQFALVSMIDTDRQWVKARAGIDVREVPRDVTFCGHVVYLREPLIVPDATQDARFADNPFVTGDMHLRYYIGIPLITHDGFALGTLCCFDDQPKPYPSEDTLDALRCLTEGVVEALEQRLAHVAAEERIERLQEQRAQLLAEAETSEDGKAHTGLGDSAVLRDAIDALPDALLLFDKHDKLQLVNASARNVLGDFSNVFQRGMSFEELVRAVVDRGAMGTGGRDVEEYVRDRIAAHARQAYVEDRKVSERWLRCTERRTGDGGIACVYSDITDLKNGEAALAQKGRLLQAVLDSVDQGIAAFDSDNRLIARNDRLLEMLDIPAAAALPGTSARELAQYDAALPDQLELLVEARRYEYGLPSRDIQRSDGRIVQGCGNALAGGGFVASYSDVTAARARAQDLRARATFDEVLAKIASIANQSVCSRDAVASILPLLCAYTGSTVGQAFLRQQRSRRMELGPIFRTASLAASVEAVLQDPDFELDGAAESIPGLAALERQVATAPDLSVVPGVRAETACFAGLRAGFAIPILVGLDVAGLIECYGTSATGLTPTQTAVLKYTAAQLSRLAEREQAQRMKNEFVSTVSHELRTPLTSIRGSLGLLLGPLGDLLSDHPRHLVEIAHRNAERLIGLVNDILDIEKIEAGALEFQMASVPLERLLEEAVEANSSYAAEYKTELVLNPVPSGLTVTGDRQRLLQVLANLLSNAVKFSPEGARVELSMTAAHGTAEIVVQDYGSGIPESFHSRIFSKFAQADASDARGKNGTGLGLSIVRSIVERHGGSVRFESQPGDTRFIVTLPVHGTVQRPVDAADSAVVDDRSRVLVCEDDADIAGVLAALVEGEGFAADIAVDAAAARRMLDSGDYAALTLDLRLPDEDGLALLRSLRTQPRFAALPTVVVSAFAAEASAAEGPDWHHEGAVEWMNKPIDAGRLHRVLQGVAAVQADRMARVLHVEDDPDLPLLVRRMLDGTAELHSVGTVAAARELLRTRSFDLVIVDMELADGTGLEVLEEIGADGPPVLMFSASEPPPEAAQRLAAALVKSRTSETELVARIVELIDSAPRRAQRR